MKSKVKALISNSDLSRESKKPICFYNKFMKTTFLKDRQININATYLIEWAAHSRDFLNLIIQKLFRKQVQLLSMMALKINLTFLFARISIQAALVLSLQIKTQFCLTLTFNWTLTCSTLTFLKKFRALTNYLTRLSRNIANNNLQ